MRQAAYRRRSHVRHALRAAAVTGVLAAILAAAAPAEASCTRYASPTGDDTAAGTETAPFKTAQRLVSSLEAGWTGCLRGGRYDASALTFPTAGTATKRITLTSYPGERATISADHVYVPHSSAFVTMSHLTIDGQPYAAPTVQVMAPDAVLDSDTITNHNLAESCVILGNLHGYGAAERPIIRRNRLYDCGNPLNGLHDHAIYIENTTDASITDNVIWHAAAYGIQLYPDAQDTTITRNVIDGSAGGIMIAGEAAGGEYDTALATSGTTAEYNVVSNSTRFGVQSSWDGLVGTGNVVRFNCLFHNAMGGIDRSAGGMTAAGNRGSDPLYVNAARHDYRLQAGSPCMRADTAGNPPPAIDLTSPSAGTGFGSYVCPRATADDDFRVTFVRFTLDGTRMLDDDSADYGSCWTVPSTVTAGAHTLTARAYDEDGGSAYSSVRVWRDGQGAPTGPAPPTVTLTSPLGGTEFGDSVCPAATAADDAGVTRVRFYLDAKVVLVNTAPPYGSCVDTTALAAGSHSLTVRAEDDDGGAAGNTVTIVKR